MRKSLDTHLNAPENKALLDGTSAEFPESRSGFRGIGTGPA